MKNKKTIIKGKQKFMAEVFNNFFDNDLAVQELQDSVRMAKKKAQDIFSGIGLGFMSIAGTKAAYLHMTDMSFSQSESGVITGAALAGLYFMSKGFKKKIEAKKAPEKIENIREQVQEAFSEGKFDDALKSVNSKNLSLKKKIKRAAENMHNQEIRQRNKGPEI